MAQKLDPDSRTSFEAIGMRCNREYVLSYSYYNTPHCCRCADHDAEAVASAARMGLVVVAAVRLTMVKMNHGGENQVSRSDFHCDSVDSYQTTKKMHLASFPVNTRRVTMHLRDAALFSHADYFKRVT